MIYISDVTVYKKSEIHGIFDNNKASASVAAPKAIATLSFAARVSHLVVSCDDMNVAIVTDNNNISLVDVRTLNEQPAVFAQATLSAKCR